MWYVDGKYFKIAGVHMTEDEFNAVENYKNNIYGTQYQLTDQNVIVAGTPLEIKGLNHELKSILRDYNGHLGTDVIGMGHVNINTREETSESLAELKGVFPFKKNYLYTMPADRVYCDCDKVEEDVENHEVKGEEEVINTNVNNPKTKDNILYYLMLLLFSMSLLMIVKKQIRG